MILIFWMLSLRQLFHSPLSPSSRDSLDPLISAIRMVSSAYPRLLIFLRAILIPACASSSPTCHMMYSAYKLNKQGDNIYPWRTPFLIWNQSVVPYPDPTVASWPAYRFLRRQVRLKNFPQFVVIHTVKGFGVVSEAEVDVFLELSCFFNDPMNVDNLIFGFSAFSKSSLNIWKFTVHWSLFYWSLAWWILSITLLVCEMSAIVEGNFGKK